MKLNDFRKFVDRYPNFKKIELSNFGEIFLNPELKDIIEYAYTKKIALTVQNGVNLNTVDEETLESLIKYKLKLLSVSLDGASGEVYEAYRIGGNFEKVIENIRKINYYKQKYDSKFPELMWQFIAFGHNEHELGLAKKMARELGMGFKVKLNWSSTYSPVKDEELVRKEAGFASEREYRDKTGRFYMVLCSQLWDSPQINWDGKLLGCCVNKWGDFGNVFEVGLRKCVRSEKYIYAKKMIMGQNAPREDIPCFQCPYYEEMCSLKNFFQLPRRLSFYKRLING